MPNKIEGSLPHDRLVAFLDELRAMSAKPTLTMIQAAAKRYGIDVSLMGAKTFRDNTFAAHLQRLAAGREKSAQILAAVREGGAHPLDAVEEAAAADLLDAYTSGEDVDVEQLVKVALNLRGSIEQRKNRDRSDRDLDRKLADSEAKRANDARRIEVLEERLRLMQLDAAKAALAHVKELRLIASDGKATDAEKLERARVRLFGEASADVPTLGQLDSRKGAGT